MEEETTLPSLTISEGGDIIGEAISDVGVVAGEIVENLADAIEQVADLFTEITDIIGEALVPIYDVSYLGIINCQRLMLWMPIFNISFTQL